MEYEIVFVAAAVLAILLGSATFATLTTNEPVNRMTFGWMTLVIFLTERAGSALAAMMPGWNAPISLSLFVTAVAMYFFGRLAGGYALFLEKKQSWGLWALVPFGWVVMLFANQPTGTHLAAVHDHKTSS